MGSSMKKFFSLIIMAAIGWLIYRQVENQRIEADLWTEATAPMDLR